MQDAGSALMGIGQARGENRASEAARMAVSSPLLEASIEGAQGVLLTIAGGSDLGLHEVNEAAEIIADAADADANIIFGTVIDDALGDEVKVTVIAAGFAGEQNERSGMLRPVTSSRSRSGEGERQRAGGRGDRAAREPEPEPSRAPEQTADVTRISNGDNGTRPSQRPARPPVVIEADDELDIPSFLKR
jgi:cell division protein FtsZ